MDQRSRTPATATAIIVSAWVTDERARAGRGARLSSTSASSTTRTTSTAIRAERQQSIDGRERRQPRAARPTAGKRQGQERRAGHGPRAARRLLREQRRPLHLDRGQRPRRVTYTEPNGDQLSYTGPTLTAEWYDAAGNRMGGGNLDDLHRPRRQPRLLPVPLPGLPDRQQGRRRPRSRHRSRSRPPTATSTRSPPRSGSPRTRPSYASDFLQRLQHALLRRAGGATRRCATSPPSSRTSPRSIELPEKTTGYQRKAQTMLGYQRDASLRSRSTPYVRLDASNLPVAGAAPTTAQQPRTVVLTSKDWATWAATAHRRSSSTPARRTTRRSASRSPATRSRVNLGHQRHRRDHEHRRAGHRRDQRPPGRPRRSSPRRKYRTNTRRRRRRGRARCLAAQRPAARPGDRPARPADPVHAADRQGARRLQGRRVPLLPGARQRDRDLGRLPRDRGAPRAQLRDRSRDHGARRQPGHLHRPADQRRRRDPLAV